MADLLAVALVTERQAAALRTVERAVMATVMANIQAVVVQETLGGVVLVAKAMVMPVALAQVAR